MISFPLLDFFCTLTHFWKKSENSLKDFVSPLGDNFFYGDSFLREMIRMVSDLRMVYEWFFKLRFVIFSRNDWKKV